MTTELHRFPMTALVGIDNLKLALVLNAIDPKIGGVLVRGDKGTAKSTAVRALASLLPSVEVYEGDAFNCGPGDESFGLADTSKPLVMRRPRVVDLPIGTTEDRVTGTLNLERTLRTGERQFEPGLLAEAHKGILYIDEVNLLPDHLVDLLLDVVASGVNVVEREGNSVAHPSRFVLVGTMNPEEGELRPQLLDRFGLMVVVEAPREPSQRIEVVRRRIAYDTDPATFIAKYQVEEQALAESIRAAQDNLTSVQFPDAMLDLTVQLCIEAQVDGLRPDIIIYRAAAAIAALESRAVVTEQDVYRAALLVLPHRQRRRPLDQQHDTVESVEDLIQEHMAQANASPQEMQDDQEDVPPNDGESESPPPSREDSGESGTRLPDRTVDVGARISLRLPDAKRRPRAMLLGRDSSKAKSSLGRVVRHRQWDGHTIDIAPLATVVSAAPRLARGMIDGATALAIEPEDIRMRQRLARSGRLVLFLVDGSGSMGAQERMRVTKAAIMSLLQQRYEKRDKVAIQVFRDDRVELVLRPTSSIDEAARLLRTLPTGGRTPLAMALDEALAFIKKQHSISSYDDAMLVVITDGRSNDAGLQAAAQAVRESGLETFVIDAESGTVRLWRAKALAEMIGAVYLDLNEYERH